MEREVSVAEAVCLRFSFLHRRKEREGSTVCVFVCIYRGPIFIKITSLFFFFFSFIFFLFFLLFKNIIILDYKIIILF